MPRSNKNGSHVMLKPIPCLIKKLLKTSKTGKIFTYRRTESGKRYKQYCKQHKMSITKPNEKASLFKVGSIKQGYKVVTVRVGSGRKKQWRKL